MLRTSILTTFVLVAAVAALAGGDEEAITATALDYGQGWYAGDAERMEGALHPDLAKRHLSVNPRSGKAEIRHMSAMKLVQATRAGWGKNTPEDQRRTDVTILEVYGDAAVVKLVMHDWVDFLQMSKIDDRWVIVNVLWELTPEAKSRRNKG
jgi:hypothetical protein